MHLSRRPCRLRAMHNAEGILVLSATDLVGHLECEHLTQLERRAALGEVRRPTLADPSLDLLSMPGEEHAQLHLERYRGHGAPTAVIESRAATAGELRLPDAATVH